MGQARRVITAAFVVAITPSVTDVAGSYSATTFTTTNGGSTKDQVVGGASLALTLADNGTTTGRLGVTLGK